MANPLSVRATAAALGADGEPGGLRVSRLLRHVRWPDGWQGAGPLSARALLRTTATATLRQALRTIGPAPAPASLREAYQRLGYPLGGGATRLPDRTLSLGETVRRVIGPRVTPVRFLSYNTYLLPGIQLPIDSWIDEALGWDALPRFGIPFDGLLARLGLDLIPLLAVTEILNRAGLTPSKVISRLTGIDLSAVRLSPKPALDARAAEIGPALADYDLCCLCEVWRPETADTLLRGARAAHGDPWRAATGPGAGGSLNIYGSGLCLLSRRYPVLHTERRVFGQRGDLLHDSDAWTNKGVMLNVIDTGVGELEVFQTHLYYGGGLAGPAPGALESMLRMREPTDDERRSVWRSELDDIAAFYREHHRPDNVAVLTGDFNLSGANIREYALVRQVTDALGLRDVWAWDVFGHAPSDGYTCRYTDSEPMERDFAGVCGPAGAPDGEGSYCDDRRVLDRQRTGVGRFDFLFIAHPRREHTYRLEVSRVRRRPFRRASPTEGETFLSDHLGLDATLYLSRR